MTTLRDRLLALADDCELIRGDLVLAAARMALEELEARNKPLEARPHTLASENADRYRGFRDGAIACQNTARALRDGLG